MDQGRTTICYKWKIGEIHVKWQKKMVHVPCASLNFLPTQRRMKLSQKKIDKAFSVEFQRNRTAVGQWWMVFWLFSQMECEA